MDKEEKKRKQQQQSTHKWVENNKDYSNYSRGKSATKSFIKQADFGDIELIEELLANRKAELNLLTLEEQFELITVKSAMIKKVTIYDITAKENVELRRDIKNKILKDLKLDWTSQKLTKLYGDWLDSQIKNKKKDEV